MSKSYWEDWYIDGECPHITVYQQEEIYEPILFDAEGNPLYKKKIKLGFDLSGDEFKNN